MHLISMRRNAAILGALTIAVAVAVVLWAASLTAATSSSSAAVAAARPPCSTGSEVRTKAGPVCGLTAGGVTSYLGIPYAAAPIGDLRWEPPGPVRNWTTPFQATHSGNICPGPGTAAPVTTESEDCLNLNIQVPARRSAHRLPVMVEIHGGGFLLPIGPSDGSHLVTAGHVVYVAMNYRLGILGFMANKALGPHSGDYGLQDQQASLRWVQQNIAAFGGDPHNVTIFGQSAGGASVCAQVASPTATGLFEQGIPESGFYNAAIGPNRVWEPADCKSQIPTQRQAQRAGAIFAAKLNCRASNLACLRAVPVQRLVAAGGKVNDPTAGGTSATIAPTVNGSTLTMSPAKAFQTGRVNRVGLMNGIDRDEINGGASLTSPIANSRTDFYRQIRIQYRSLASRVLRIYRLVDFPSPFIAYRTVVADSDSVCPAIVADRKLSRYLHVYAWENDDADMPPEYYPQFLIQSKPYGAYHIAATPLLFPRPGITLSPDQAALAAQFTAEATEYSHAGNPAARGTPRWPAFTRRGENVMSLVPAGDSVINPAAIINKQHHCDFWNAVTRRPKS